MRKISRVLVTCALLGIAVVGLTGCGMNSSAELAANENYWDGDVPFKRVEVPAINDANTRAMALQSGDIDMAINIGPGEYSLFTNNKDYTVTEASSLRDVMARI